MNSWKIVEHEDGVQFRIKVQPRASKNEIGDLQGDALKIKLTAPPVDGEANEACVKWLARWLGVPKNRVTILSGHTSQHKLIHVTGLTKEELLKILNI